MITVLALLSTSAYARFGETVKQVEARYGKPQKVFIDRPDLRKVGYGYRGFMLVGLSGCLSSDAFSSKRGFQAKAFKRGPNVNDLLRKTQ